MVRGIVPAMDALLPGLDAARHIHPMFVHVPLVLLPGALVFWLLGLLRRRDDLWSIGSIVLYVGIASAIVTIITGFAAADQLGHDAPGHEAVHVHRNFMLIGTGLVIAVATTAFALRLHRAPSVRWGLVGALTVALSVLVLGADRGAYLVFGQGVGVDLQPADEGPGDGDAHDGDAPAGGAHDGHAH